jgi:putative PIG3 family NAD(P)H quinone oxidoreductase
MKAIVFDTPGDESVLKLGDAPPPALGPDDVRIAVRATAVNRADLLQRQGMYPPPPGASPILGLECAGEISEVGSNVRGWTVGERAMALLAGGGYAAEAVVHAGSVMRVPAALSDAEAGAVPEVFLTAFLNIFMLGEPPAGGSVLVHGGGSGVGTAAISLCKAAGLRVLVTAGSAEKCERCLAHGADVAINYRDGDFVDAVRAATGGAGVNVVLDAIGAKYLESNLNALALEGRLVLIGLMGGTRSEIDLAGLMLKRVQVIGSTLRTRSHAEKAAIVTAFTDRFGTALAAGTLRPVLDRVLPLAQAGEAHRIMKASEHFGKIGLRVE